MDLALPRIGLRTRRRRPRGPWERFWYAYMGLCLVVGFWNAVEFFVDDGGVGEKVIDLGCVALMGVTFASCRRAWKDAKRRGL